MRKRVTSLPNTTGLVISGNSPLAEREASILSDQGLLVARYSQFYGGPSAYTGNSSEQAGYSFDFPKRSSVVKSFLENRATLDAILERNPTKVRESVDKLNRKLKEPIIITPCFDRVMS